MSGSSASASQHGSSTALQIRDFTMACTNNRLSRDVEMEGTGPRMVQGPTWLSDMYSDLVLEIEYLGNIIGELQRQGQDARAIAPSIAQAYDLAIHYQNELFQYDRKQLRDAQREDFLRFEAASKQFAAEVQMGIRFLDLSVDQRTQEVGTKLLAQIDRQAAINTAQMERFNMWSIDSDKKQALLKPQLEADKKSMDTLSTELEC